MKISAQDLRNLGACGGAVETFVTKFGEKPVKVNKANALKAAEAGLDLNWFLNRKGGWEAANAFDNDAYRAENQYHKDFCGELAKFEQNKDVKAANQESMRLYEIAAAKRDNARELIRRERDAAISLAYAKYETAMQPVHAAYQQANEEARVAYRKLAAKSLKKWEATQAKLSRALNVVKAKLFVKHLKAVS